MAADLCDTNIVAISIVYGRRWMSATNCERAFGWGNWTGIQPSPRNPA